MTYEIAKKLVVCEHGIEYPDSCKNCEKEIAKLFTPKKKPHLCTLQHLAFCGICKKTNIK